MSDSRHIEGQTPTKEKSTAKTIKLRQEFVFFDKPVPSGKDEIVQTADIIDQEQLIGALVGRIFTGSGERISATGAHIAFTIHKGQDEVNTNADMDNEIDQFGIRFETPLIYMTFSSGQKYASLGTHQESKGISFTGWITVDKNEKEDKNKIKKLLQNRKAQPLPFRLHELLEAKFKLV